MKNISFSKLWEFCAYCKVKIIHLPRQKFGRVYMSQKQGSRERNLQRLKGIINCSQKKVDPFE